MFKKKYKIRLHSQKEDSNVQVVSEALVDNTKIV